MRSTFTAVLGAATLALFCLAPAQVDADEVWQVTPSSAVNLLCNVGGTTVTASPLAEGTYRFIAAGGETVNVCFAATCVSPAGMSLVVGTNEPVPVSPSSVVSCNSATGAGKLQIVPASRVR